MAINTGINVSRRINNRSTNIISDEIKQVRTQGVLPVLYAAVVVEVFLNPATLTVEEKEHLQDSICNPELVSTMPRNSILARMITNSHDLGDPRPRIIYPLFPSHMAFPIKAGEQVWIIYPDPTTDINIKGYWLTRIAEQGTIEDLNFTHSDRRFDLNNDPNSFSTTERARGINQDIVPDFPNGGNTPDTFSLFVSGVNDRPYETIFNSSIANKQITFEPVPRYSKRPGEFVFQGSNNARIVLGEDRVGTVFRVSQSNQITDKINFAGSIDLVAGVGSIKKFPRNKDESPSEGSHNATSPRIIQNSRRFNEVNKTPYLQRQNDNQNEGDPDFDTDLSRVLISMRTAGDKNFNLRKQNLIPDGRLITNISDLPDGDRDGQAFIVAKSEHIRIIAKGKDSENGFETPGTIKIVKEAERPNGTDLGFIFINHLGEIIQSGKRVHITTNEDNGKIFLGTQAANEDEPYIKYSEFVKVVDGLQAQLDQLKNGLQSVIQAIQTSAPASFCTPFSPDPAFSTMLAQVSTIVPRIEPQIQREKTNVSNAKSNSRSTKIFGK